MPKLVNRNPKYRKHRPSGQAVVTIHGRDHYLGPHGTAASRREYDRLIGEWLTGGRRGLVDRAGDLSVVELIATYWRFAQEYYKPPPGGSDGELDGIRLALGQLKRLYADTPASAFGPLSLKAVRDAMVRAGWSRTYTNMQVNRVRRLFKWAVENELVPPSVVHGLQAVGGLRRGKTTARETVPVAPVPEKDVNAIKDFVSRQVWAIIELQLITGMRPGEVVAMRGGDVDTSARPWVYRPPTHKTAHRGHSRVVYLGPRAQVVLAGFMTLDPQAYLFRPCDAESERRAEAHAARTTPRACGNSPGMNVRRHPAKKPAGRYTVDSYRRAIAYGCDHAFPPPPELARLRIAANGRKAKGATRWETRSEWRARLGEEKWAALTKWRRGHRWHPHQLRHTAATRLRKQYGLEAAQVILGHRTLSVTEIYAAKNVEAAQRIMSEAG